MNNFFGRFLGHIGRFLDHIGRLFYQTSGHTVYHATVGRLSGRDVLRAWTRVRPQNGRQQTQEFSGEKKMFASLNRIARLFLVHDTKTGKNVPNENKMYRIVIKYSKWP
jgi:hypothetical protein